MSLLTCPVCKGSMREMDREGVTIDVCTQCRGVWLDRGELEKLSAALARIPGATGTVEAFREDRRTDRDDDRRGFERRPERRDWDDDDDRRRYGGQAPYKKSKMSRLLDFFD